MPFDLDLDLDDSDDAILAISAIDEDDPRTGGPGHPEPLGPLDVDRRGGAECGCGGCGCGGCGCGGCLLPVLVVGAAIAAGLGAWPLVAVLGLAALALALMDHPPGDRAAW